MPNEALLFKSSGRLFHILRSAPCCLGGLGGPQWGLLQISLPYDSLMSLYSECQFDSKKICQNVEFLKISFNEEGRWFFVY